MPAVTAVLLAGLAVTFLLYRSFDMDDMDYPDWANVRSTAIISVLFAGYIVAAPVLGYLLSTWLVLSLITVATSDASMRVAVLWPAILASASYAMFRSVGTYLPSGVFGF